MKRKRGYLAGISPWFILGIVAIIIPVFAFITWDNIRRQRDNVRELLLAQGAALIRSFEAGTRTGAGLKWGPFQLQKLLIEMAQQPDLNYILVVNSKGVILADSDPAMIGETYGQDLDLSRHAQAKQVEWRIVSRADGSETFEVFRGFYPWEEEKPQDDLLSLPGSIGAGSAEAPVGGLVIFIGINMDPVTKARDKDITHTTTMALILFFIGLSGAITFLFAQAYRSARVSLSQTRALAESLIDHMPVGLLALDKEGRLTSFNHEAERILRHNLSEALDKDLGASLPSSLSDLPEEIRKGKGLIEKELVLAETGKTIHFEVITTALKDEEGQFRGQIILLMDTTELKHLKDEVVKNQRLASLGNLAAGIAHEIRNPLSSIKGFATFFKERFLDSPEDAKTAEIMIQEVDRLNRVISHLLEFARPANLRREPVEMNGIIRQALEIVSGLAEKKGVSVINQVTPESINIMGDKDQLKQVMLNLCLNALEAIGKGGAMTVTLGKRDPQLARISVADNGEGIAKKDLPHIFDPYFTTKPTGTGLGLAIVHRIIEAHGGEIKAESEPGRGTEIAILIPRYVS